MRIRCRQNAPQRTMRVASKSYSFCLSFRWGFRLQRARAQPAQADSLADSGKSMQVGWRNVPESLGQALQQLKAAPTSHSRQIDAACAGPSRQIEQPLEEPGLREPELPSWTSWISLSQ